MPRADWNSLGNYEIKLPSLPEQTAISSILTALDDKIELNLQQNKTLEQMAMAFYKHWFVDFGSFQNEEYSNYFYTIEYEIEEFLGIKSMTKANSQVMRMNKFFSRIN